MHGPDHIGTLILAELFRCPPILALLAQKDTWQLNLLQQFSLS